MALQETRFAGDVVKSEFGSIYVNILLALEIGSAGVRRTVL